MWEKEEIIMTIPCRIRKPASAQENIAAIFAQPRRY
jgi:hypothetical protein